MKYFRGIAFLSALIFTTACGDLFDNKPEEDYPPILPEETQTGQNRLGCLINDTIFVNSKFRQFWGWGNTEPIYARYSNATYPGLLFHRYLEIYAHGSDRTQIALHIYYPREKDTINIYRASYNTMLSEKLPQHRFLDDTSGKIYFTRFDTINGIISGRFEFTAREIDGKENFIGDSVIHVREGRFDMKLNILEYSAN